MTSEGEEQYSNV